MKTWQNKLEELVKNQKKYLYGIEALTLVLLFFIFLCLVVSITSLFVLVLGEAPIFAKLIGDLPLWVRLVAHAVSFGCCFLWIHREWNTIKGFFAKPTKDWH